MNLFQIDSEAYGEDSETAHAAVGRKQYPDPAGVGTESSAKAVLGLSELQD